MTQPDPWEGGGCEGSEDPLFLEFLTVCTTHLGLPQVELRCTPRVLVKRLTLFVYRVFDTAEDCRVPTAASMLVKAVQDVKHEDWRGLLHVTTFCTPRAGKVNPDIVLSRLGPLGSHVIPQDVWDHTVPPDLYGQGLREFDLETPWVDVGGNDRPRAPAWVSNEVSKFVSVLKRRWLLYDLSEDLPPSCCTFIIPKTFEEVSLILTCVKQNGLDGCTPPRFSRRSWEELSKLLFTLYPGVLL